MFKQNKIRLIATLIITVIFLVGGSFLIVKNIIKASTIGPAIVQAAAGCGDPSVSETTITWETPTVDTIGKVEYGLDTTYGAETPEETEPAKTHSVVIDDLTANTLYHYRIVAHKKDSVEKQESDDQTFTTGDCNKNGNCNSNGNGNGNSNGNGNGNGNRNGNGNGNGNGNSNGNGNYNSNTAYCCDCYCEAKICVRHEDDECQNVSCNNCCVGRCGSLPPQ